MLQPTRSGFLRLAKYEVSIGRHKLRHSDQLLHFNCRGPGRREVVTMVSRRFTPLLALLLLPSTAEAIQLHWFSGATDLSFASARRCTLVVQSEAGAALPAEWKLLWQSDPGTVSPVTMPSGGACVTSVAQMSRIIPPLTPSDSASNVFTAAFCSSGAAASTATYLFDVAPGAHGRFRVIAFGASDTTALASSNVVTCNAGGATPFTPTILRAYYQHDSTSLVITALGNGLAGTTGATLVDPANAWRFPVTVLDASETRVRMSASTIAAVPACNLLVNAGSAIASAPIAQEPLSSPLIPYASSQEMYDPDPGYYPKDFAVVQTPGKIHVFYIRHNSHVSNDSTENKFGHQWTTDWATWHTDGSPADTTVLDVKNGSWWDKLHVWAPTIRQSGMTFYMFYTGVNDTLTTFGHTQNQRIGYAYSTNLTSWTRVTSPSYICNDVVWADPAPVAYTTRSQQFRDPFVMPDATPGHQGHWLMYYVTVDKSITPNMVVGLARSRDSLLTGPWDDLGRLTSTDRFNNGGWGDVESPHVFSHSGVWWIFFTPGGQDRIILENNSVGSPADTAAIEWGNRNYLYSYLNNDATVKYWFASEYLAVGDPRVGGHEILAAVNDTLAALSFTRMTWLGTLPDRFVLSNPTAAVDERSTGRRYAGDMWWELGAGGAGGATFGMRVGERGHLVLDVFDIQGRFVRRVFEGDVQPGIQRVRWDGKGAGGGNVGSGVFFGRLQGMKKAQTVKVVVMR